MTILQETLHEVDYGRKWYVLLAVAMGIFLATIDGSIVNVALPTFQETFNTSFAVVQWVMLSYLLTVTTLMLGIGRLADMLGKRPLYLAGFVIFTLGSALCAFAPTIGVLIAFRVLQAIGAAMVQALGIAILTEAFPAEERGRALGIGGLMVSIGVVTGPTLGGLLLDALSWHWIFLVNLPIGLLGIWIALRNVPAVQPPGGETFDVWGAVTLFAALCTLLLGLTLGQEWGFGELWVQAMLGAAVVVFGLFVWIEWRQRYPMVELRLFRTLQFSTNLGTGFLSYLSIGGMFILLPFFLQGVLGYDVRLVGLLLAVVPVALGVTAPVAGALSDRFGTRPISVLGLALLMIGFLCAATTTVETTIAGYVVRFLPIGLGMGIFTSPNNSAIMGAVPRARLGIASGLLSITRTLGQTSGIAILGAFWASRVARYDGIEQAAAATRAASGAQVQALADAFLLMAGLTLISLLFALRTWWMERHVADHPGQIRPQPALAAEQDAPSA